jgi:hypothetical protein
MHNLLMLSYLCAIKIDAQADSPSMHEIISTMKTTQITDPEKARQFRLFGKIIGLMTAERLRILQAATKEGAQR